MYKLFFLTFISVKIMAIDKELSLADKAAGFDPTIIVLAHTSQKNSNIGQVSNVIGCFLGLVDLCKSLQIYCSYKKWLKNLSYQEFLVTFSYVVHVEEQIKKIQDLLQLSQSGTFPEQISARINLARLSLSPPYDRVVHDCLEKYIGHHFDKQGKFVWRDQNTVDQDYKKFYKKVPQDFKALAKKAKKIPQTDEQIFFSDIGSITQNQYNQTLLDMIHAGIESHFPRLKQLCRRYYDSLIERLYQYYIHQKVKERLTSYGAYKSADYDPIVQKLPEHIRESQARLMTEELILREWYHQELKEWLLLPSCQTERAVIVLYEGLLAGQEIKELPLCQDYRFVLLRNFINTICCGNQTRSDVYEDFFLPSGVLRTYENHGLIKGRLKGLLLRDELLHRAFNFALAISDKEKDEPTQKLCKTLVDIIILASTVQEKKDFQFCKNKIVQIYEVLSYKTY